jgi:predicted transposase YbfD/YdcC
MLFLRDLPRCSLFCCDDANWRKSRDPDRSVWNLNRGKWEGLRSVGMVESIREINGKVQTERRYYLSSLPLGIEDFARAVRCHWGIENKLHWVLDVQLREDESRARTGNAPENLATLRRLALNLLKKDQTKKRGIRGNQLNAGWDHAYLLNLLSF